MASTTNKRKKIYFDFFQCEVIASQQLPTVINMNVIFQDLKSALEDSNISTDKKIFGHTININKIERTQYGYRGIICKYRTENLPHAGTLNGDERELILSEGEHLIEKTFFKYFHDCSLLIMQRNWNAINYNQFSGYLSRHDCTVSLNPIIKAADLQLLMSNTSNLKWAKLQIARPTNLELFDPNKHDLDNAIYATLGSSKAATINMTLRGDARSNDPEKRYLSPALKRAFYELQDKFDVRKAQLELEEGGIAHPIDLISDRLVYYEEIELHGRYPDAHDMWSALMNAKGSKQEELDSYFGIQDNRIS